MACTWGKEKAGLGPSRWAGATVSEGAITGGEGAGGEGKEFNVDRVRDDKYRCWGSRLQEPGAQGF